MTTFAHNPIENLGNKNIFNITVIVSALGYFVDIYDLLLFSIVRTQSLRDIGLPDADLLVAGVSLLNYQMTGLLIGGIVWGILGDKRGRVSVLFGSILIYSLANLANGFVESLEAYQFWRLIAGFGLAGELGAAITLVSETLPQSKRGYGTAIVAGLGILGAVAAALISDVLSWRHCYILGGVLGLLLLVMRVSLFESGLFEKTKSMAVGRGNMGLLFGSRKRFMTYLACIAVGVPIWFVVGILVTFSPELSKELQVAGVVSAGRAVMFCYAGLCLGDLLSGFLSQRFGSRKKVLVIFQGMTFAFSLLYLFSKGLSLTEFYGLCFVLGVTCGYWAVFMTVAAEQFGTNLRATVTTTAPNFVRGAVVPMTTAFHFLALQWGLIGGALTVGVISISAALLATFYLPETHHRDLHFVET